MNPKALLKAVDAATKKNAPTILTGIGIAGMIATVVVSVKVTSKACKLLDEAKEEKERVLSKKETVQTVWKCYLPVALTGAASILCVISANKINTKRNAALNAACALAMSSAKEYSDKVIETIGEEKESEIRDEIAKDKMARTPASQSKVFATGMGDTLCFDAWTGRYFKSDVNEIKRVLNDVNYVMLNENGISLNEFYYAIGLDGVKCGEEIGWNIDQGMLELRFSTQLSDDGKPCLVMDFKTRPNSPF